MNSIAHKIFNSLITEIADKKLNVGDRIPTENELASRFKTNRMNARTAVMELEERGLVKRNKRQGTTISKPINDSTLGDLCNAASRTIYFFTATPLPGSYSHWDDSTLFELEKILNQNGIIVTYNKMPKDSDELSKKLTQIEAKGSKAIIFFPGNRMSVLLEGSHILKRFNGDAFIFNSGTISNLNLPCHSVNFCPYREGELVGNYLIKKGYNSTVFLAELFGDGKFPYWVESRLAGLRQEFAASSDSVSPPELIEGALSEIVLKAADYIRRSSPPVAIVAQNDQLGAQIIDALSKDGLTMGKEYGLVGFDNDMRLRNYNMTTVTPPVDKIGEALADLVLKTWTKSGGFKVSIEVESKIISRTT